MNHLNSFENKNLVYQPKVELPIPQNLPNTNEIMLNNPSRVINNCRMNFGMNKCVDQGVEFNQNYAMINGGFSPMVVGHPNEPSVLFFANPIVFEAIPVSNCNYNDSQFWMWEALNQYGSNSFPFQYWGNQNASFGSLNNRVDFENLEEVKQVIGAVNPNLSKDEMYDEMLKSYQYQKVIEMDEVTHKQKISYVCKYGEWNKVYTKIWNLLDHVRMHEGIRPFKCKFWPKSFTQKGNLKKHQIQHTISTLRERKRFKCNICNKGYTEKYNLEVNLFKFFKFIFFFIF